jgi:acyl carrier protein
LSVEEQVIEVIHSELNVDVGAESTIESLGVDSLELLDLLSNIERATGVEIPDERITEMESVSDIIRVVGELKQ